MKRILKIKVTQNGKALLNIGCGTIMHRDWNNLDFSPYAFLKRHGIIRFFFLSLSLISNNQSKKLAKIDPKIIFWDVRKGLPFDDNKFDVIYSSHLIEHLSKADAIFLLRECHRSMKKEAVIRIATPDLEKLFLIYSETINRKRKNIRQHLKAIELIFEQIVRIEPARLSKQKGLTKIIQRLIRKSALSAGEVHKWLYDKYSLHYYLKKSGFKNITIFDHKASNINDWRKYNLDLDPNGNPHKPLSLYIEAEK